jgi:hypothetical protein
MVNRDLLKEAIADAKAVKETAIANAKAALEEAFTPMMQKKFAAKLEEMDNEDDTMEEGKAAYEYEKGKEAGEKMQEMYDVEEAEAKSTDSMKEEGIDEIDLEELLRELDEMGVEENINLTSFPDEAGEHGNVAGQNVNEAEEEEEMEYEDEDADGIEDSEDEEIDIENMDESDLKSFIESVIADMVAAGELEGGEGAESEESEESEEVEINERKKYGGNKGDVPASKRGDKKDTAEEEGVEDYKKKKKMKENYEMEEAFDPSAISLSPEEFMQAVKLAGATISGLIGGGAAMANKEEIGAALKGAFEKVKGKLGMAKTNEMEEMKDELAEAYQTIKTIQTELQEVNLFNAKLLYTNKIFKAKTLTESQKVKVLAAFDKAASVKEAKLVFETLSEGFKEKKSPVNESLLRGSASRAAGVADKKPILEVNDQFARWQTLAGIKK